MTKDIFSDYLKVANRKALNEGALQINEDDRTSQVAGILEFVSAVFESTTKTKFKGHDAAEYVTSILYDDFTTLFTKNPDGFDFHKFRSDNFNWASRLPSVKLKGFMEDYDFRILAGDLLIGAGTSVRDMLLHGDFLASMTRLALSEIADMCLQTLESMLEFEDMINRNGLLISEKVIGKGNREFKSGDVIEVRHETGSIEPFRFVSFVDSDTIKMRSALNGAVYIIDADSKKIITEDTKSLYKTIYYEGASNSNYVRFAFVDAAGAKAGVTFDKYMASTLPERKIEGGGPLPTPEEAKAKIIKNIMKAGYITQMNRRMEANDIVKKNTGDLDKTLKLLLAKNYVKNITARGFKIPH